MPSDRPTDEEEQYEIEEGMTLGIADDRFTVDDVDGDRVFFESGEQVALESVKRDLRRGVSRVIDDE